MKDMANTLRKKTVMFEKRRLSMDTDWRVILNFWPLLLLQIILAVVALLDIRKRQSLKHLPKAAWIAIIIFVNTLGPIFYFLIARGDADERH